MGGYGQWVALQQQQYYFRLSEHGHSRLATRRSTKTGMWFFVHLVTERRGGRLRWGAK